MRFGSTNNVTKSSNADARKRFAFYTHTRKPQLFTEMREHIEKNLLKPDAKNFKCHHNYVSANKSVFFFFLIGNVKTFW